VLLAGEAVQLLATAPGQGALRAGLQQGVGAARRVSLSSRVAASSRAAVPLSGRWSCRRLGPRPPRPEALRGSAVQGGQQLRRWPGLVCGSAPRAVWVWLTRFPGAGAGAAAGGQGPAGRPQFGADGRPWRCWCSAKQGRSCCRGCPPQLVFSRRPAGHQALAKFGAEPSPQAVRPRRGSEAAPEAEAGRAASAGCRRSYRAAAAPADSPSGWTARQRGPVRRRALARSSKTRGVAKT